MFCFTILLVRGKSIFLTHIAQILRKIDERLVKKLLFFGTILDPVFADFPSSSGMGSRPKTSLQDLAQPQTYHP